MQDEITITIEIDDSIQLHKLGLLCNRLPNDGHICCITPVDRASPWI